MRRCRRGPIGLAAVIALTLRSAVVTDAELTDADHDGRTDSRIDAARAVLQGPAPAGGPSIATLWNPLLSSYV